jgi:hypothetical protein
MSNSRLVDSMAIRADGTTLSIPNPYGVPVTLFANRDVPIEVEALEQALGVQTVEDAQVAGRVARLEPLLTIKG